jgi:hypothetical protein
MKNTKTSSLQYPEYSNGVVIKPSMKERWEQSKKATQKPTVTRKYKRRPNPLTVTLYLNSKVTYGQYEGKTVQWVMDNNIHYLKWFMTIHKGNVHLYPSDM